VVAAVVVGVVTEVATGVSPAWVLAAGGLAAALPFVWLRDRVAGRHDEILRDLPYDLDLLTLSVEAGLDFTAAVQKVVDRGKRGPLRDELQAFLAALRMGKTRAGALAAMGERVGLPELASVVSALVQADHLGTGLARTLRAQAEQLRVERFQRAETRAGEAPVRMLVPLVLFVFPTLWIVLGAPLVFEYFFAGR
jgi:tight adherence protein C